MKRKVDKVEIVVDLRILRKSIVRYMISQDDATVENVRKNHSVHTLNEVI